MDFKLDKKNIGVVLSVIALLIMTVWTFKMLFLSPHLMFRDEAHAWTIAKYCSLSDMYKLMHVEGHMLLWYILLIPFARLNLDYYICLKFINWLFMILAMGILVKYSKINPFFKCFIVLSPIIVFNSLFARCYGIGIFFLFLACAMYKDKLKYPFRYYLLLLLAANTSILALFCAFGMGIIFLYELFVEKIKTNKDIHIPILISIFTLLFAIFIFFQFIPFKIPSYQMGFSYYNNIVSDFFFYGNFGFNFKSLVVFIYASAVFLFFSKPKAGFIYLFSILSSLFLFIFVYSPYRWHWYFLFIYMIIALWIYMEEDKSVVNISRYLNLFIFLLLCLNFKFRYTPPSENVQFPSQIIKYSAILRTNKVFVANSPGLLPLIIAELDKYGIFLYDLNNRNLSLYEGLVTYYDRKRSNNSIDYFYNNVLPKGTNLLLVDKRRIKNIDYEISKINSALLLNNHLIYNLYKITKP